MARLSVCSSISHSAADLKGRLDADGYLLLRDFFERKQIIQVRSAILRSVLGVSSDRESQYVKDQYFFKAVQDSGHLPEVKELIHNGKLQDLFSDILGGPSKAFDFVWSRIIGPRQCETPHCDTVYMNRGTMNLYTAWIPLGDIPLTHGPLMILEGSHRLAKLNRYRALDVDRNRIRRLFVYKHRKVFQGFHYSRNVKMVQRELGSRWLTSDFEAGDVLIFSVHHLHGTLDNQSDSLRVVLDARYQLSCEPLDARYFGNPPVGHTISQKTWIRTKFPRLLNQLSGTRFRF